MQSQWCQRALGLGGVLLLLVTLSAGSGCQQEITGQQVRSDLTPELHSIALTEEQWANRATRSMDTNMRAVWDDLGSMFFLDRPVRLSRYPIP